MNGKDKPLEGLKVLEIGTTIAGPTCSHILANFGAEVIKIEPPGKGDPMRVWGQAQKEDRGLWWLSLNRNKKCITLNMRDPEGQKIAKKLVEKVDIMVENFRPGKVEEWGMGIDDLKKINKGIILVRISGYGQTGPYHKRPGFGGGAEALGGLRYITGYPDRPPVRVGVAIGDTVAAMQGAIGALMAVYNRDVRGGEGQEVDVALYEAVFALMDAALPEYDKLGLVKERTGPTLPKIAPSNIYPTKDNEYVYIGANQDNLFQRLARLMEKPELAEDPRYATHLERGERQEELDNIIKEWTKQYNADELIKMLEEAHVPMSPIYSIADIAEDPHFHAREMIREVEDPAWGKVKVPGIVPKLSETPGDIEWPGPGLGQHNEEVYKDLLGMEQKDYEDLKSRGII